MIFGQHNFSNFELIYCGQFKNHFMVWSIPIQLVACNAFISKERYWMEHRSRIEPTWYLSMFTFVFGHSQMSVDKLLIKMSIRTHNILESYELNKSVLLNKYVYSHSDIKAVDSIHSTNAAVWVHQNANDENDYLLRDLSNICLIRICYLMFVWFITFIMWNYANKSMMWAHCVRMTFIQARKERQISLLLCAP